MGVKEKISIYIVTYNRKWYLERTLGYIFQENSPIKDFPISILDNASTDGTSELIEEYSLKYSNITHIRHKINIGGRANINRAFELGACSGKEYVWILCDDDILDFSNWSEVEKEINAQTDIICVADYCFPTPKTKTDFAYQNLALTFVPAGIYKTSNITDTVITNMYDTIYTILQQNCVTISVQNNNKRIKVLSKPIVYNGIFCKDACQNISYMRGSLESETFKRIQDTSWILGYSNILTLLKDKNLQKECMQVAILSDAILGSWSNFYNQIKILYFRQHKYNYVYEIYNMLKWKQKLFLIIFFLCLPITKIIDFYKGYNSYYICLFGKLKIRIYSSKWFEKFFSTTDSKGKKSKIIDNKRFICDTIIK